MLVNLDVDVDLDDFEDSDLMDEIKSRGLLNSSDCLTDLVELIKANSNATVIQHGICEPYEIKIGGKIALSSNGRATIIILDGE